MKSEQLRLLIVVLLLFAGFALQPLPCRAASETNAGLDERQRMRIFDEVWQTVQKWYYDRAFGGVDWKAVRKDFRQRAAVAPDDDAFHALIAEMLALLNDSHTYYMPPVRYSAFARAGVVGRGFAVAEIEGRFVVTSVDPALAELQSGIRPGLALRTINDQPVEARARDVDTLIGRSIGLSSEKVLAFFRRQEILRAPAEQPMTLAFVDPMGNPVEVRIDKALASRTEPPVTSRRLASELGYVRWTTWDLRTDEIRAHLASLGNVPGLIIDLRGNQGGDPQVAVDVLSCLFKDAVPYGLFYGGRRSPPKIKSHPCPHTYTGPLAVLMAGESGSTSEIFANLIQENRRGLLVGQPSAASVVYRRHWEVRGGGRISMGLWDYKSPQGRRLQGTGVVPDIVAETTIAGLWEGRDEILEAAERTLKPRAVRGSGSLANRQALYSNRNACGGAMAACDIRLGGWVALMSITDCLED
jgi:carboxyl-terminal processing protease